MKWRGPRLAALVVTLAACGEAAPRAGTPTPTLSDTTSTAPASASPTMAAASPRPPSVRGLVYIEYRKNATPGEQPYSYVVANLDGTGKVRRSLGDYPRPRELQIVSSRNGRYLAWSDGGELRTAATTQLAEPVTVVRGSGSRYSDPAGARERTILSPLAVSEDGATILYQTSHYEPNAADASTRELSLADVATKTVRSIGKFSGRCFAKASLDEQATKVGLIGCGEGALAGLAVIDVSDGTILFEDRAFRAYSGQLVIGRDLDTVWLVEPTDDEENRLVRYDIPSRKRTTLYRSPGWRQSDGSVAPNLGGFLVSSPDQETLAFRRYPSDKVPEVHTISSSGGAATMLLKDRRIGRIESWSPDGTYVAVSYGNPDSSPERRILYINPRNKETAFFEDGDSTFLEFIAWVAS